MALVSIFSLKHRFLVENKKGLLLLFCTACYIGYLALGGLCFLYIEGPQEDALHKKIIAAKAKIMRKYPNVTEEALDEYMNDLSSFRVRGLIPINSTAKWSYSEAVFFSMTLLTTIGYGHVSPISQLGKAFCMVYSGIGIPLTLVLLASYVECLMRLSEMFKKALFCTFTQILKPVAIQFIHIGTIIFSIVVVWFLLPALLFSHLEIGWTYLDALYFCFISLTTIGLGDFVPAQRGNQPFINLYRFGVTFYVVAGVTVMMFMMSLTSEFQQSFRRCYQETLPCGFASEKIPINHSNRANLGAYGTIVVHNSKITKEREKNKNVIIHA